MIARLLKLSLRTARRVGSATRSMAARLTGVQMGSGCTIAPGCELALFTRPHRHGSLCLGSRCELSRGVILHPYGGSIRLGENVFIGPYTVVYGHGGVEIGDHTLVAMHCRIVSSNHATPSPEQTIRGEPDQPLPTKIGRDVWLGAGVTVLAGVTIGDGCVVGAGAVVTRDLPPYSIALGLPAHVTGSRIRAS
jgi:acetyltransferase-like isoleucine patch superfamily enzyme